MKSLCLKIVEALEEKAFAFDQMIWAQEEYIERFHR